MLREESVLNLLSLERCNTHRIIESFRLEKTFKIIEYNSLPNAAKSATKPCP